MSRTFKEVIEVAEVKDEYYRLGTLLATLEEVHFVRSQRSVEGDCTVRWVMLLDRTNTLLTLEGGEFLDAGWQEISRKTFLELREAV